MKTVENVLGGHARPGPGWKPVRSAPVVGQTFEAKRLSTAGRKLEQDFSYTVIVVPPFGQAAGDRREVRRTRTRLRSGKLVDVRGRFMTECLVHDLSALGSRLRLPPAVGLPSTVQLFDDQSGILYLARVLWRRGAEAGLKFIPSPPTKQSQATANEMRRRMYKVQY